MTIAYPPAYPQAPPRAEFDTEGNVTIHIHASAPHDLGFPHFRRFVEQVIPDGLFDWDGWQEPSALWVHWRYACEAVYQFTRYYADTVVTAEANPHFGQPAVVIIGRFRQQAATATP